MEHRRLGRLEQMDSVLIFGGAALAEVSDEEADHAISASLEAGVNHFDTAAGYGDSELHLGRWMPQIRDGIFLSTTSPNARFTTPWSAWAWTKWTSYNFTP